jgi:alpha-galactosidase
MVYEASDLPSSLTLNAATGRISGSALKRGLYRVKLRVKNRLGADERDLSISVGDTVSATPPMGWNSWNCWGREIDQDKVLAAARGLVANQLNEHGWSYVNIDDGWQGSRSEDDHAIEPNPRFPDMKRLANEVHSLGLKFGLYSTPWRATPGRYNGTSSDQPNGVDRWIATGDYNQYYQYNIPSFRSWLDRYGWLNFLSNRLRKEKRRAFTGQMKRFGKYSFASQDARQWTRWGVDYLKYDWAPVDLRHVAIMHDALAAAPRDIFYSVSNNAPLSIANRLAQVANSWRTSVDLKDTWESMRSIGFSRDRWAPFNGPGHYNDSDMLLIGDLRWNRPKLTRLTSDEQYTHISLWCLLSGPLLLGCRLDDLDAFTLGLITNDEVLDVDQDPLCRQAICVARKEANLVYAKPLEDGSLAVGLFNLGKSKSRVRASWKDLKIQGPFRVRDLWRQKDIGVFSDYFETSVASHGVVLVRLIKARIESATP